MGRFINSGNGGFVITLNKEYVDKTGLIAFMNSQLDTEDRFICCTRARRFGKTIAAKMLCAYYDKSCDSRSLFEGLEIASDRPANPLRPDGPKMCDTFREHLNKYPTIYIDMTKFVSAGNTHREDFVSVISRTLIKDLAAAYPEIGLVDDMPLDDAIYEIYESTREKFIFIMDEWDAILRECKDDSVKENWIGLLRSLFKEETTGSVFAGVYLTGILPIIKYNTQSALNNFREYNIISPGPIARLLGFTGDEVSALCIKHGMDYNSMCSWYDGYETRTLSHIFNPNSVIKAIEYGYMDSYWASTGAGDELIPYLKTEYESDIRTLMEGGSIPVDTQSFNNTLSDIQSRDKALTALIHLGYLSYDGDMARIPNQELMLYFASNIKNADLGGLTEALSKSEKVLRHIRRNEPDQVSRLVAYFHDEVCGAQEYNKEQLLYTTLREALFYAHTEYIFHREYPTGKGFADLVLIPRRGNNAPGIVIELKWDKGAEGPIAQIKERDYARKVFEYTREVILVGINYDKDTKEHQCTLERLSTS